MFNGSFSYLVFLLSIGLLLAMSLYTICVSLIRLCPVSVILLLSPFLIGCDYFPSNLFDPSLQTNKQ